MTEPPRENQPLGAGGPPGDPAGEPGIDGRQRNAVMRVQLEELMADAERQQGQLQALSEQVRQVSATVSSRDDAVTVTAGPQGSISDLRFSAYATRQHAADRLAELTLETIRTAQEQVAQQVAEIVQPLMPAGVDAEALTSGQAFDVGSLLPPGFGEPPPAR